VILAVDDDESMIAFIEELLRSYGCEHISFSEPEKALEFFAWNAEKVDLIISDVVMPGINGLDLAREVARLKADTPVILLSGYGETLTEAAALPNVKAVLEKPLVRTDLLQTVEGVLAQGHRSS
jgi:DNA-binding NtrC family response regulator